MPTICERMNEWREPRPIDFQWSLQVSCQLPLSSPPSGPEAPPRRGGPPPQQTQTEIGQKIGLTDPAALFRFPFLVASIKIGVNEHETVFLYFQFRFRNVCFQSEMIWHLTNVSVTLSMLFCWCCLLFYLSEKRMNGWREMTGDSSNIGCLEALAVPSTNNSAQSAPKALIPAGLYTRGCILWCIQRRNTLHRILCISSSSSRGMFYRVGDKPWLITEAHVTLLALHLSQTEKAPFLSICYLYFFFS